MYPRVFIMSVAPVVLITVLSLVGPGQSHARETVESPIEFAGGLFLGHPQVAVHLAQLGFQRRVFVDRIVVERQSSDVDKVCVQLSWFGGDTAGSFGTLEGSVRGERAGRGRNYEITDVTRTPERQTCD